MSNECCIGFIYKLSWLVFLQTSSAVDGLLFSEAFGNGFYIILRVALFCLWLLTVEKKNTSRKISSLSFKK